MKEYDVCGLGNAIVDILVSIPEERFQELKVERGTMRLVDQDEQGNILSKLSESKRHMASGGSVANSTILISQLGGKCAFFGCVADDLYGNFYRREFDALGIDFPTKSLESGVTGTSLILITPDAERTMRTNLGISTSLSNEHICEDPIAKSQWLFVEGYVLANPLNMGQGAIKKALGIAARHDCRVAVTFSDAWVVRDFELPLREALAQADLVFANAEEAQAFSHRETVEEAFHVMREHFPNVVVTGGSQGAYVSYDGMVGHVDACHCNPVDLTGAGDVFAGSFIYGITHGFDPITSAHAGCFLARKVILQIGARLENGVCEAWAEATAA